MNTKGHINTFSQGMDKDTASQKYSNMKYEHAENLRIITDEGLTTGAMLNVEGNEKLIEFPPIVRISKRGNPNTFNSFEVFFNSDPNDSTDVASGTFTNTPIDNVQPLVDAINNNVGYSGLTAYTGGTVTSDGKPNDFTLVSTNGKDITGIGTVNQTSSSSWAGFSFNIISKYFILGSTTIRDSIYIFTTFDITATGGEGQIWKVDYDDSTLATTISLVYAGALNMTAQHLVEAVGRYETSDIKRLYWTDNFNPVRSINTEDPDRFSIKPGLLALTAEVTLTPAKFTTIGEQDSGLLDVGTYQVSYRVQTRSGTTTAIAPWSVPISINAADESVEHWNYQRADHNISFTKANKSLTFSVEEIPEGYNYLEIFLLKRGISEGVLYKVDTVTLGEQEDIQYKITGTEGEFEEIFSDEIENFNIVFDTAKTINIKDNRLLVGNITEKSQYIDYDARAYRVRRTDSTSYEDPINNPDDINPFNKDSTMFDSSTNGAHDGRQLYRYKYNGGGRFGGLGDKIGYEFTTREILLDNKAPDAASTYEGYPMVDINKTIESVNINNVTYPFNNKLWNNYRNPFLEHLLAGYQRGEVYRFGILFYDLYSRPMDVKWIGDIRMPEHYDEDANSNYDITYTNTDGELIGRALGLKFNVDISGIEDTISGFSIVRSPRPNKDKTILGQGVLGDVAKVSESYYFLDGSEAADGNTSVDTLATKGVYADPLDIGYLRDKEGVDTWLEGGAKPSEEIEAVNPKEVLMPLSRLNPFTDDILTGVESYSEVVTFDSPQLLNGFGDPLLYGNIIGDESQGIAGSFAGMELKPIRAFTSTNGFGVRLFNGYEVDSQEKEPNGAVHYANNEPNATEFETGGLNVPMYMCKYYNSRLFKLDPVATPTSTPINTNDTVSNKIPVEGGIRMNFFNDNFLVNTNTRTNLLNLTDNKDLKFHGIDLNTRTNSNTNSIILGLKGEAAAWYNKIFNTVGSIYEYKGAGDMGHFRIGGQGKIVANLYRENKGQYGGDTKADIEKSTYVSTGHYQKVIKGQTDYSAEVFGGDTYINLINQVINYPSEKLNSNRDKLDFVVNQDTVLLEPNFPVIRKIVPGSARHYGAMSYPIESTVNMDMRFEKEYTDYIEEEERDDRTEAEQYYINGREIHSTTTAYPFAKSGPFTAEGQGAYDFLLDHTYKNRISTDIAKFQAEDYSKTFFSLSSDNIITSEYDNRVYASQPKINGEKTDSWKVFKLNNSLDVDGHYGPINKLEVLNEQVIFFQDKGVGIIAVNPRSLITDAGGAQLELGSGDVLHDYDYISTQLGCKHQKAIQKSRSSIYFFDANSRKFYRFRGKNEPLSDMKGMSSYFYNNFKGSILSEDNMLTGSGFATGFDPRYNEVIFTYRDVTANEGTTLETIAYSEAIDAFSSFYSFISDHYITDGSRLFSRASATGDLYVHNEGTRCSFYGLDPSPSVLRTIVNPQGVSNKIFNNIEYLAQLTDTNGTDILNETFDSLKVYNEYQSVTKEIVTYGNPLISLNQMHARRRMRNWRMAIPRSEESVNGIINKARIRNPYTTMEFTYNNNEDKKLILNDIITYYSDVPM